MNAVKYPKSCVHGYLPHVDMPPLIKDLCRTEDLLFIHDHTPVAFNLARLPRHQVSPDRPRYRAHSISFNRDLDIFPLIPNLIHRTDNRSGA